MDSLSSDQTKSMKYIIKNIPVGEAQDCLEHLTNLVGNKDLVHKEPNVIQALKKFYETHRYHINLPGDKIGMVHPSGSLGQDENDFTYHDHTINTTFKFDPITLIGEVVSSDPMELPTCDLRDQLIAEATTYVAKAFRKPKCKFNIHQDGDKQLIDFSCLNINLPNFWTGEWQSHYVLENGQLSGQIKINCHYYEKGNMQQSFLKNFESIKCKDGTNAVEVIAAILKEEETYQKSLEDIYENIKENVLTKMRRNQLVHGQKFNWDKKPDIIA